MFIFITCCVLIEVSLLRVDFTCCCTVVKSFYSSLTKFFCRWVYVLLQCQHLLFLGEGFFFLIDFKKFFFKACMMCVWGEGSDSALACGWTSQDDSVDPSSTCMWIQLNSGI